MQLIPVGAVQALVNVQLLSKIPPFKQLLNIPFTNAIIVSILPGVYALAYYQMEVLRADCMGLRHRLASAVLIKFLK